MGVGKKGAKNDGGGSEKGLRAPGGSPAPRLARLALRNRAPRPSVEEGLASSRTPPRGGALRPPVGVRQVPVAPL